MEEITISNGLMTYRGQEYNYSYATHIDTAVFIRLYDDINEGLVTVVANEVSINGIVQTSAQMIIDTLSSDGQS
jgi:hypothetical protein